MSAVRHVLELIAAGELEVTRQVVDGLAVALDDALEAYAVATDEANAERRQV